MTTQDQNETIDKVNERVDWAIQKLQTIRRMVSKGGPTAEYHFTELREIVDSLRHHTEKLGIIRE